MSSFHFCILYFLCHINSVAQLINKLVPVSIFAQIRNAKELRSSYNNYCSWYFSMSHILKDDPSHPVYIKCGRLRIHGSGFCCDLYSVFTEDAVINIDLFKREENKKISSINVWADLRDARIGWKTRDANFLTKTPCFSVVNWFYWNQKPPKLTTIFSLAISVLLRISSQHALLL